MVLARQKQHVPVVVAKGTSTRSTVFKAWKRAFPHLRAAAGCRSRQPGAQRPWTYVGRHGHARWRQPAGNPACEVKSDPPAWLLRLPSHALPLPVRRLIVPTHPAAACRARDYSTRGAMPARARRRFNLNQVLCARALAQVCGRRPAASGTTAWARRRPGGGESARTSRPLTTRRFAATGLSHSHPLPTLAALLCFVRTASPILHAVRGGAELSSAVCAVLPRVGLGRRALH